MKAYTFYKEENGQWFIDLPDYLAGGGVKADLQMIDGADSMLDIAAAGNDRVTLYLSEEVFDGAHELVLLEECDPIIGGGDYFLQTFEERDVSHKMWLCQVTAFVFGSIPERIYVKRIR